VTPAAAIGSAVYLVALLLVSKYPDITLMPLCSDHLYPGSAAILAASGAGETPALPGKTMQKFLSRYLLGMGGAIS
jgi:hypothetical protein